MKIGFIGLGKLGYPVALTLANRDHEVHGYDTSTMSLYYANTSSWPHKEEGIDLLDRTQLQASDQIENLEGSEIIFIAVQTPHEPQYGGTSPTSHLDTKDFDYSALTAALDAVYRKLTCNRVVIISTCLPGTLDQLANKYPTLDIVYNPFFIAMGTTITDFLHPEIVLVGERPRPAPCTRSWLTELYADIHADRPPIILTSYINAELTKVLYNTFISQKIAFANTVMELAYKTGGNCDSVHEALSHATQRIISTAYMRGGMGDGGACHPRDNIAMSHLAKKHELSHDIFKDAMRAREDQTLWLAKLIKHHWLLNKMPVIILGTSYKPNTDLTDGSPALLLHHYLHQLEVPFGTEEYPQIKGLSPPPKLFFIATAHEKYRTRQFPPESTVLDPHAIIPKTDPRVNVIHIGR